MWLPPQKAALELRGQTTSVPVLVVSGDCFETLGVHAALGRLIEPADDRREADRVIAISYDSWQHDFDGRSDVLGQRVRLDDGDSFEIVGVVARSFRGLVIGFPPRIYVPVRQVKLPSRVPYASLGQTVFARLRDGDTTTGAAVRLETEWAGWMAASIPTALDGTEREHHLAQRPVVGSAATGLDYSLRGRFGRPITSLLLIASLALLLCALNVANLLRARAADQRRETAVRLALGGTRWHIARQMLLESAFMLSAAVVAGLVVGYWCDRLLIATFQSSSPNFSIDVTPDVRTFVFASGATIVAFLVFAIGPALTSSNVDANALRVSTRTTGDFVQRGRIGLVLQVVMTLIVVANGAAFVDALSSLRHAPLGIDLERVLAVQLRGLPGGYVNGWGPTSYYRTLVDRMRDIPGVMAASLSADPPLGRGSRPVGVTVASAEMIGIDAEEILVTDRFFETMKIPLLAGEDFRPTDTARIDRTVIVSESLARRLFGSGNPLGRRIRTGTNPESQRQQIVGIARDAVLSHPQTRQTLVVYQNWWQAPIVVPTLLLRTRGEPTAIATAVRNELHREGREFPTDIRTLHETLEGTLAQERLLASLSGAFAVLGLGLAAVGLYGLLAFTVAHRTSEIGVRIALGASRISIVRLVVGDALVVLIAGLAIGIPLAWGSVRIASRVLFDHHSPDAGPIVAAIALLLVTGTIAAAAPALRAMSLNPVDALRRH